MKRLIGLARHLVRQVVKRIAKPSEPVGLVLVKQSWVVHLLRVISKEVAPSFPDLESQAILRRSLYEFERLCRASELPGFEVTAFTARRGAQALPVAAIAKLLTEVNEQVVRMVDLKEAVALAAAFGEINAALQLTTVAAVAYDCQFVRPGEELEAVRRFDLLHLAALMLPPLAAVIVGLVAGMGFYLAAIVSAMELAIYHGLGKVKSKLLAFLTSVVQIAAVGSVMVLRAPDRQHEFMFLMATVCLMFGSLGAWLAYTRPWERIPESREG